MTYPSIYPTGATIYNPDSCFNGYTVFQAKEVGAMLIDMNGAEVKLWKGLHGFPNKIFPGGYVLGHTGERPNAYGMQDQTDLVQVDFDGNIVWKFNKWEFIEDPGEEPQWMARQHHDYQREGNPVGYYVPGMDPLVDRGNTMILCHKNVVNPSISDKPLLDDAIIEVTWEGDILWEWLCNEHFEELDFSEEARNILSRNPNMVPSGGGMGDWIHINAFSALGPNKWYDNGDQRFHPDNIIWDGRETDIIAIIDLNCDAFYGAMNQKKFNGMPDNLKKIMLDTTGVNMARICGKTLDEGAISDADWMKGKGHTFYVLPKAEKKIGAKS